MTPPQPSLQKPASSVPVEKTPKEQKKCVVISVVESSHRKTHSGQVVQDKSKSKNIKAPPPPNPTKYSFGSPMLTNLFTAGTKLSNAAVHSASWVEGAAEGFTPKGEPIVRVAEGFHARVVQHECDHLIGRLYPSRIKDFSKFGFIEVLFPDLEPGTQE